VAGRSLGGGKIAHCHPHRTRAHGLQGTQVTIDKRGDGVGGGAGQLGFHPSRSSGATVGGERMCLCSIGDWNEAM
jgi:hypothetical protein